MHKSAHYALKEPQKSNCNV